MCQHPTRQVNYLENGFCVRRILANFLRHPVEEKLAILLSFLLPGGSS